MNALSSRRYTECVDRLTSVLGLLSMYIQERLKRPYSTEPALRVINSRANIVKCGRNTYRYTSNNRGQTNVWIWTDGGWRLVYGNYIPIPERDAIDLIQEFELEVQP